MLRGIALAGDCSLREPDGKVPSLQRDWKPRGVGDAGPSQ